MGFEKFKRPLDVRTASDSDILTGRTKFAVGTATSAGTLGSKEGFFSLESTSTGDAAGLVFELPAMSTAGGDLLGLSVGVVGATSAPLNIVATTDATFDGTNDVMLLGSSNSGAIMVSLSTARWLILGVSDATFAATT